MARVRAHGVERWVGGPIAFLVVALLTLALSWAAGVHHAVAAIGYCPD